jgi:predicted MFS family arabinose efflux permease
MLVRIFNHWRSSYRGISPTIWFLSLVSLVNRCGGMVIAFLSLYMTQELGFGIREAGYVMGCFGLGALSGAYLGGRLTDRLGYYPVQLWSLVLNGLMLLLLVLVRDFWAMCLAVFVLSLISEVFRPANSVAIALHSSPETRTRSISLYRMSVNLGWAVAPALGGVLAMLGWHWLFWVDGLTCLFAAFMLRTWLPDKGRSAPHERQQDQPLENEETVIPEKAFSPYRDTTYVVFLLLTLLNAIVFMQIIWTVPVFFKEAYGWDTGLIGLVAALNGVIVFLVEMPLIYRIDGRRPAMQFIRVGLLLYALSYLAFMVLPAGLAAALVFTVAISLGEIFVMPFSTNFAFQRSGLVNRGQYMGLYTMAYSLANILAPLIGTQMIAAFGYHALWGLLIALSAVSWFGFRLLQARGERKEEIGDRKEEVGEREAVAT